MGVTRFSYAASKACPQYARDRWKLAPASHNVNATKRLYSPDLRDNRVDDVNRPINWRCASRVEVVNGNCGLVFSQIEQNSPAVGIQPFLSQAADFEQPILIRQRRGLRHLEQHCIKVISAQLANSGAC